MLLNTLKKLILVSKEAQPQSLTLDNEEVKQQFLAAYLKYISLSPDSSGISCSQIGPCFAVCDYSLDFNKKFIVVKTWKRKQSIRILS